MTLSPRRLSRTLIAVTAAAAPVVALAPAAQAAPSGSPALPRQPLAPTTPKAPVLTTPRILPTPSPTSTVTMYVETSAGVNARSGPSTSYPVVGGYAQGTKLTGSLTSNNWLKIADGKFVAAWNLTTSAPGGGGGGSSTTVTRWMTADIGNVRSGPGLNYSVVTTLRKGAEVRGTVTSNGWLKIADGKFVSGTILTATDPGGGGGGGGGSTTVTRWMAADIGNVRSGAGLSYPVVTTLRKGAEVTGTMTSNGWLNMGGGKFVSGTILTSTDPGGGGGGGEDPAPVVTVTRWVSVPSANVRSGPGTSYSIVGAKAKDALVTGTLTSNGWLKMSGSQYMSGSVLTDVDPGKGVAPTPAPNPSRQAILDTAAQYVGFPYVLYGTPPQAFDCSSYTWYIYKLNGIDIPRTVRDQKTFVTPVTTPQPGDLVFYKNWYHVGIYAGPGMSYEAQNPDTDVVYGPIWDDEVWYGRVPGMP